MNTKNQISMMLFSGERCGICQAIKPKLRAMINELPAVDLLQIDAASQPELAASHSVFSIPTLLIIAEGKEYRRYHGAFSMQTVANDLQRLIALMQP